MVHRFSFFAITVVILVLLFPTSLLAQRTSELEQPYPPAGWNLSLDDPLNTNDGNWELDSSCQFTAGVYQVSAKANQTAGCIEKNADYSNFAFETKINQSSGKGEFIGFRLDTNAGDGYGLFIDQKGKYDLILEKDKETSIILAGGTSSAIHTGHNQSNLLAVVAQGNTFDLYVNRHLIRTITDQKNTSDHGDIGLGVDAPNNKPSEASFSEVKVWVPSATTPSTTATTQ